MGKGRYPNLGEIDLGAHWKKKKGSFQQPGSGTNRNEHLLMLKSWLLKTILHLKKSGIHGETTDFSTGTGENTSWGSCSARKQGSAEGMMETWLKDTRASLSRCPLAKDGTIQASKQ